MQISVKFLQGSNIQIEADESDKVTDLKQKIAAERTEAVVENQKLIYAGKVLRDEQTVGECGISGDGFLVCMVTKVCFFSITLLYLFLLLKKPSLFFALTKPFFLFF